MGNRTRDQQVAVERESGRGDRLGWRQPTLHLLSTTRGTLAANPTGRKCTPAEGAGTKTASGTEGCDFGNSALIAGGS